jgi:transcriptional regulator with XRE-family HTH domain
MSEAMPDPVDVHVGRALRARRQELGQSQSDLAEALGVSFQQIQKYERGANRISASMMFRAARAQQVAPAYYFEGLEPGERAPPTAEALEVRTWLAGGQAWALGEAMRRMSPAARAALLQFARDVAS